MTPAQHLTKIEYYYTQYKANGYLLGAGHSDFLFHCTEFLKLMKYKGNRDDIRMMMDEVVHAQGIPGAMYGNLPGFRQQDWPSATRSLGGDCRDQNGRWCTSKDMPNVVIDWSDEEDLAWEREQEYAEAYRESLFQKWA